MKKDSTIDQSLLMEQEREKWKYAKCILAYSRELIETG